MWGLYNFLSSGFLSCLFLEFSWVDFLFICCGNHSHHLRPDFALNGFKATHLRHLVLLTFCCDTKCKAYFGVSWVEPSTNWSHHISTPLRNKRQTPADCLHESHIVFIFIYPLLNFLVYVGLKILEHCQLGFYFIIVVIVRPGMKDASQIAAVGMSGAGWPDVAHPANSSFPVLSYLSSRLISLPRLMDCLL